MRYGPFWPREMRPLDFGWTSLRGTRVTTRYIKRCMVKSWKKESYCSYKIIPKVILLLWRWNFYLFMCFCAMWVLPFVIKFLKLIFMSSIYPYHIISTYLSISYIINLIPIIFRTSPWQYYKQPSYFYPFILIILHSCIPSIIYPSFLHPHCCFS